MRDEFYTKFKIKFFDYDPTCYFLFALMISEMNTRKFSIGVELFGMRIFYFNIKRIRKGTPERYI